MAYTKTKTHEILNDQLRANSDSLLLVFSGMCFVFQIEIPSQCTSVLSKHLTISDTTDSIMVKLWRNTSALNVKTGDYIEIVDGVTNIYKELISVNVNHLEQISVSIITAITIHSCQ